MAVVKSRISLFAIKFVHTLIWLFFNAIIFYLLYAVLSNKIDVWAWICIAVVMTEGIVLLAFGNMCPLTVAARKYSNSTKSNFDIWLPEWLAKYNKQIYTSIFLISVAILLYRLFSAKTGMH